MFRSKDRRSRMRNNLPFDTDRLNAWWRRGRAQAGDVMEQVSEEVIPGVQQRLGDLRDEAAPRVARVAGQVERASSQASDYLPRRRRSRRSKVMRGLAATALVAFALAVAYLLWQRRDTQPAYLVQEPEGPLPSPAAPSPGLPDAPRDEPGDGPTPEAPEPVAHSHGSRPEPARAEEPAPVEAQADAAAEPSSMAGADAVVPAEAPAVEQADEPDPGDSRRAPPSDVTPQPTASTSGVASAQGESVIASAVRQAVERQTLRRD